MTRLGRLAAVLVVTATFVLGTATAASARRPESWTDPEPRPLLETLGIFVGIPLALFLVIIVLSVAAASRREPRYRPDREWGADAVWIGSDQPGASAEPAAEQAAIGSQRPARSIAAEASARGGGASARW